MLREFKEFLARGNVVELAVAVVLGVAFGAIVNSLVADVITPALLAPAMEAAGVRNLAELTWNGIAYGRFLAAVVSFVVIAFTVFLLARSYTRFMKRFEAPKIAAAAVPTREEALLEEIRDLLARTSAERPAA